jgi:hypothetical protein
MSGSLAKWFAWIQVLAGRDDTIDRHFSILDGLGLDVLCMSGGGLCLGWCMIISMIPISGGLLYRTLSPRKKAFMDLISAVFLFFPLMTMFLVSSAAWAIRAWRINETMTATFWYPPAGPYRTVFAIGIILLMFQGIAKSIRDAYFLIRGESLIELIHKS